MKYTRLFLLAGMALICTFASSQNPVIRDQFSSGLKGQKPGIQNLFLMLKGDNPVEADWISFE